MSKNNISAIDNLLCCGCGGCYAVCPSGCIEFAKNEEGCYIAKVIDSFCSSCESCVNVCPAVDGMKNSLNMQRGRLYAMRVRNKEMLAASTAGGIAMQIAYQVVEAGGMVLGAGFSFDTKEVSGEIIGGSIELNKIKGAKFLQSDSSKAFRIAINTAKENPKAFFAVFGTPCQIYGIRKVAESLNIDNRFFFIDVFCGGVSPYSIFESYIKKLERKFVKPLSAINFADKEKGSKKKHIKIEFGDEVYHKPYAQDDFMKAYRDKILINPACADCRLRMYSSAADIRLGEYKDSEGKFKKDTEGISSVLILSEKGKRLIKAIKNIEILREYDINECLREQSISSYKNEELRSSASQEFAKTKSLKKTISFYRKSLPLKVRLEILVDYIKSIFY